MSGKVQGELVVLYDRDCGFCRWSLDKLLAWDRRGRLRPVAIQSEEGAELLQPLPRSVWLGSFHVVTPSGDVRSAGDAAEPLFAALPLGSPLALFARTFPAVTGWVYRRIAENRNRIAGWLRIDASCELRR